MLAHALAARPCLGTLRPLVALVESLVQFSLGAARPALLAHDVSGLAEELLTSADEVVHEAADVYASASAALRICALIESVMRRPRSHRMTDATAATTLLACPRKLVRWARSQVVAAVHSFS